MTNIQAEIDRLTAEQERLAKEIAALKAKQAEKPKRVFGVPEKDQEHFILYQKPNCSWIRTLPDYPAALKAIADALDGWNGMEPVTPAGEAAA